VLLGVHLNRDGRGAGCGRNAVAPDKLTETRKQQKAFRQHAFIVIASHGVSHHLG